MNVLRVEVQRVQCLLIAWSKNEWVAEELQCKGVGVHVMSFHTHKVGEDDRSDDNWEVVDPVLKQGLGNGQLESRRLQ